jgi:hypothetical protein
MEPILPAKYLRGATQAWLIDPYLATHARISDANVTLTAAANFPGFFPAR